MQIIESTAFGVRSAVFRFEKSGRSPDFIVFPMIHVAEAQYYAEISRRLDECDIVLFEGVGSRAGNLLTASYRFLAKNPRLGLVSQKKMDLDHLKGRLIHADVEGEAFEERWWKIATWLRFLLPIAAPIYGLYMRYFGTRAAIARGLRFDLRKSRRELLADSDEREITNVLVDWRDKRLIEAIEEQRLKPENADRTIGILFGAGHMRAVIRHLMRNHKYRVTNAEWVMVFGL